MSVVPGSVLDLTQARAGLLLQAELENPLMMFAGTEPDDAFLIHERADSEAGTIQQVRFAAPNWSELTKPRGGTLLGAEDETRYKYDQIRLDFHKFDGRVQNVYADQNAVNFDLREGEIDRMGSQWAYTWNRWMVNQLVGNVSTAVINAGAHYPLSGSNSVTAQDANHIVRAKKSDDTEPASDSAIDSTCVLTTDTLSTCFKRATSRKYVLNPIAPCKTPWGKKYVVGVGSEGLDMLLNSDPRNQFMPLQQAALAGGMDYDESAIANASGYVYLNMCIIKVPALDDPDYPVKGLSTNTTVSNTAVALFFGAGAGQFLFGKGFTDGEHLGYTEHAIHEYLSMNSFTNAGFKRTIPTDWSESWGCMRIVHYSEKA